MALERSPELPDVPAIMEFTNTERQKQILREIYESFRAETAGASAFTPDAAAVDADADVGADGAETAVSGDQSR